MSFSCTKMCLWKTDAPGKNKINMVIYRIKIMVEVNGQ